jgi:hypothetical protein
LRFSCIQQAAEAQAVVMVVVQEVQQSRIKELFFLMQQLTQ